MNSFLCKGLTLLFALLLAAGMFASPLPSSVRPAIPAEVQQLICVDYRALKNSDTAQQLKEQVLPENLKQFETALKGIGVLVDRDVDTLTFVSYRQPKQGVQIVGAAQGVFSLKTVLAKLKVKKIKPAKYHDSDIYPMAEGMEMTFLDETTLLFGGGPALRGAIDARDGYVQTLDSNPDVANLIQDVESGTVWSILDQKGTQNMMLSALGDASRLADYDTIKKHILGSRYAMNFSNGVNFDQKGTQNMMLSALGDASRLADYDTIKKHILGSRYAMNFTNGVNFDLDVITSDSVTAATLSSLVKAGVLYKKMNASPVEKAALEDVSANSDGSKLQMHFKADDKQFQSLIHTSLFAAVSR